MPLQGGNSAKAKWDLAGANIELLQFSKIGNLYKLGLYSLVFAPPQKGFFFSNVNLFAQGPSEECKKKTIARGMSEAVKAAMVAKHNELRRK